MRRRINHIACQCLILFLTIQTFNLSIDSLGFYTPLKTASPVEDPDYIDSMVEFLVENVMGFSKDTFRDKANSNNFSKQQQNIAHFDFKWFPNSIVISDLEETQKQLVYIIPKNERIVILFCKEVRPNPPQLQLV